MKIWRTCCSVMVCVVCSSVMAEPLATELTPAGRASEWEFSLSPYLWAASIEGSVAALPPAPAANIDASFSDIMSNLDIAIMMAGEARKGRWSIGGDMVYMKVGADGEVPGPLYGEADLETESLITTLATSYRLLEKERLVADIYAGARFWYANTELDLSAGFSPAANVRQDKTWVDPVVGAKTVGRVSQHLSVITGGFYGGAGGASDEDWSAMISLNYDVSETTSVAAGYRHMSVDFEDGSFSYDVEISGPVLGVLLRF